MKARWIVVGLLCICSGQVFLGVIIWLLALDE